MDNQAALHTEGEQLLGIERTVRNGWSTHRFRRSVLSFQYAEQRQDSKHALIHSEVCFQFLVVMAICTNCLLLVCLYDEEGKWRIEPGLAAILIMEHALLLIKFGDFLYFLLLYSCTDGVQFN